MKRKLLAPVVIGCGLILLSAITVFIACWIFTDMEPGPALVERVGLICLHSWWIPGVAGVVLLMYWLIKLELRVKREILALEVVGFTLMLLSAIAFFVAGGVFAAAESVPTSVEWIGGICFFTWWIPGVFCATLLILVGRKFDGQPH